MKLSGSYRLGAPQERTYDLLQEPAVLSQCLPGCKSLEKGAGGEYRMKMNFMLASISGLFDGTVRLEDVNRPASFRLIVEGSGKIGFMKGDGVLRLAGDGEGTEIAYEGEVHVGGPIAGVGQRLMEATAKLLIKRFFDELARQAAGGV